MGLALLATSSPMPSTRGAFRGMCTSSRSNNTSSKSKTFSGDVNHVGADFNDKVRIAAPQWALLCSPPVGELGAHFDSRRRSLALQGLVLARPVLAHHHRHPAPQAAVRVSVSRSSDVASGCNDTVSSVKCGPGTMAEVRGCALLSEATRALTSLQVFQDAEYKGKFTSYRGNVAQLGEFSDKVRAFASHSFRTLTRW